MSEVQRDDTFRQSLYEFQQEFSEEERGQAAGEQGRGKEFDEMMAKHHDAFETNERRREGLFREADARQEENFQKNEADRKIVFSEGQSSRAAAFENGQAGRAKRSEWYSAARQTLLLQGRQARKDACSAIEDAFTDQLNKLLRTQEDCFVLDELRRDSIVKKLVSQF